MLGDLVGLLTAPVILFLYGSLVLPQSAIQSEIVTASNDIAHGVAYCRVPSSFLSIYICSGYLQVCKFRFKQKVLHSCMKVLYSWSRSVIKYQRIKDQQMHQIQRRRLNISYRFSSYSPLSWVICQIFKAEKVLCNPLKCTALNSWGEDAWRDSWGTVQLKMYDMNIIWIHQKSLQLYLFYRWMDL